MIRNRFVFAVLFFLLAPAMVLAQSLVLPEKEDIYAIIKDMQGNKLEGILEFYPKEVTVSTKDNQEKSIPLKMIESIQIEKSQKGLPGADKVEGESQYAVRLRNSQEIFTLEKKYTFSLNASIGLVVKNIDPEAVKKYQREVALPGKSENKSFIQDRSVILSLEIKF